ncbi:hypothetical protein ACFPRL_30330 [Pseudoclavibacter helvolus]
MLPRTRMESAMIPRAACGERGVTMATGSIPTAFARSRPTSCEGAMTTTRSLMSPPISRLLRGCSCVSCSGGASGQGSRGACRRCRAPRRGPR